MEADCGIVDQSVGWPEFGAQALDHAGYFLDVGQIERRKADRPRSGRFSLAHCGLEVIALTPRHRDHLVALRRKMADDRQANTSASARYNDVTLPKSSLAGIALDDHCLYRSSVFDPRKFDHLYSELVLLPL